MSEPGVLWEDLPKAEKRIAKIILRKSITDSKKKQNLRFRVLEKALKRVLDAIEMEYNHRGYISQDNILKRDALLREMMSFINLGVKL